jgi:hypothetical protein
MFANRCQFENAQINLDLTFTLTTYAPRENFPPRIEVAIKRLEQGGWFLYMCPIWLDVQMIRESPQRGRQRAIPNGNCSYNRSLLH